MIEFNFWGIIDKYFRGAFGNIINVFSNEALIMKTRNYWTKIIYVMIIMLRSLWYSKGRKAFIMRNRISMSS